MLSNIVFEIIDFINFLDGDLQFLFTSMIPVVLVVTALAYGRQIINSIKSIFSSGD